MKQLYETINGRKGKQNKEMNTKNQNDPILGLKEEIVSNEEKEKSPQANSKRNKGESKMQLDLSKMNSPNPFQKQLKSYTPRSSGLITTRNKNGTEENQNQTFKKKKPRSIKNRKSKRLLKHDASIDNKSQKNSSVQMNCNPTEQSQQLNADENSLSQIYEDSDSDLLRFQFNENERKIMTTREIDVRNKLPQIATKKEVKKKSRKKMLTLFSHFCSL